MTHNGVWIEAQLELLRPRSSGAEMSNQNDWSSEADARTS